MADRTANSTITQKKGKKVAAAPDTIAALGTRTFTWTVANGTSEVADSFVLGKIPAGCAVLGAWTKSSANLAANVAIEYGISASANGASPSVAIANVANNGAITWVYTAASTTANTTVANAVNDGYLVATIRTANNTVAATVTTTFLLAAVEAESAPYSTFTL